MNRFHSPFETNVRVLTGWRWYARFLSEHPDMHWAVERDCWKCLFERGLISC